MTTVPLSDQPELRRSTCPLDCPDGCSLEVTVRDGRIARVDAAPVATAANPLTAGFICKKVKHHADRVYAPERIMTPLVRTGAKGSGEFRTVGWDEALDLVARAMRDSIDEHGPESIVPYLYNSSAGDLGAGFLSPMMFRALGASRVARTICAATAGAAWELTFGSMPGADVRDMDQAGLIVLWGANPAVSNTHLLPLLDRARARGVPMVAVDPRRTGAARRADLHLAVRPGTDVVVAMAVAAELERRGTLDRARLDAQAEGVDEYLAACRAWTLPQAAEVADVEIAQLVELVDLVQARGPGFFRLGWGLERNANGGAAHRAVLALAVLAGRLGEPGGGIHVHTGAEPPWAHKALATAVLGPKGSAEDRRRSPGRMLNMNHLGRWLNDDTLGPPVQVLFVQGANPAVTAPNQALVHRGLARNDLFTVVHEQVMTDTARYADVVLPAPTHFEIDNLVTPYGAYTTERVRPVIERVGMCRTNDEVVAGLALRLGFDPSRFDPDPARLLAIALPDGVPDGITHEAGTQVQFRDAWPTSSDRRARLVAPALDDVDPLPSYRSTDADIDAFPLTLLTPASPRMINSIFGESLDTGPEVHVHPVDADTRGLSNGADVIVRNGQGSLRAVLRVDADLRPGVVSMPKGAWLRTYGHPDGFGVNVLMPDELSDLAGGATFNDARVEVESVVDDPSLA